MSYNIPVNSEDSVLIHLDSRDASSYLGTTESGDSLTSYFQYILTDKLLCPSNQVMLISLYSASIPYAFYNVRGGINDAIDITISNDGANPYNHVVDIPPANYTSFSLSDKIEILINALSNATQHEFVFDMSYDDDLQKYSYSITATGSSVGDTIKIEFKFNSGDNADKTPIIEMGFRREDVFVSTTTPLTSSNCII